MDGANALLALFGRSRVHGDSDVEVARAYTGALLVLELMHELRTIRKALTTKAE